MTKKGKKETKISRFRKEKNAKQKLLQATEASYKSRDSSGRFKSYLSDTLDLPRWKCTDGDHAIDIIPYFAGDKDPTREKDELAFFLDIWVHNKIGVNEDRYVCLAKNFSKPCPICEYIQEQQKKDKYDEKYLKSIKAKRRVVYNIVCVDNPREEEKGVQIWEASHYLTERNISSIARIKRGGGGYVSYADPDEGKTIEFTKEGTGELTSYTGFKFSDREDPISDEILNSAACLDQYYERPSYEELKSVFLGDDYEVDEETSDDEYIEDEYIEEEDITEEDEDLTEDEEDLTEDEEDLTEEDEYIEEDDDPEDEDEYIEEEPEEEDDVEDEEPRKITRKRRPVVKETTERPKRKPRRRIEK